LTLLQDIYGDVDDNATISREDQAQQLQVGSRSHTFRSQPVSSSYH